MNMEVGMGMGMRILVWGVGWWRGITGWGGDNGERYWDGVWVVVRDNEMGWGW